MRTTLWILFLGASLAFAAGCNRDDHRQPNPSPRPKGEEDKVAQNNPPPKPNPPTKKEEEGFKISKKGGGNIVSNIRGTVYRTERKNELRGIYQLYTAYSQEKSSANQRNLADFLTSIKRDAGPIHDAIQEGYYRVNLRANLSGSDVIAHERDIDSMGYLSVLGDGDIRYLSAQELKQAGGMP